MKYIILSTLFFTGMVMGNQAHAQVNVHVNVNLGDQPGWGPEGYDNVEYYYLPDVEAYYYVPRHQFIYLNAGSWEFAASLPGRCRSYDLYRGYKVVINEPRPYLHHEMYRARYARYRDYYDHQPVLHDRRDHHEYDDEDGPGQGHGHGHAYGHYKEHGNGMDGDD